MSHSNALGDLDKILGPNTIGLEPEAFIESWFEHDLSVRDQHILHDFYRVVKFYQETIRDLKLMDDQTCPGCGKYLSAGDRLCPGCEAYQDHQR